MYLLTFYSEGSDLDKGYDLRETNKKIIIWHQDFLDINDVSKNLEKFFSKKKIVLSNFIHCAGFSRILPIKNFNKNLYDEIFNINFFSALEIIRILVKFTYSMFDTNLQACSLYVGGCSQW